MGVWRDGGGAGRGALADARGLGLVMLPLVPLTEEERDEFRRWAARRLLMADHKISLPAEVQPLVDQLRALIGMPACQIVINCSDDGLVQTVEPRMVFRRKKVVAESEPTPHTQQRP